jgi:hypothetical protein
MRLCVAHKFCIFSKCLRRNFHVRFESEIHFLNAEGPGFSRPFVRDFISTAGLAAPTGLLETRAPSAGLRLAAD